MWEIVSFMLAVVVLVFILNYGFDPKQLVEDFKSLSSSSSKVEALELRVSELEKVVESLLKK